MKSTAHKPQNPHLDFSNKDLPDEGHFFNAIMPLTSADSFLQVWNNPISKQKGKNEGMIVHIPYKSILIMEQDTIHAGSYKPDFLLEYERIGFHLNRKPSKYYLPGK